MGPFDPALVPGYLEACERERTNRELSFLETPIPLCGIPVRQMTPRHYLLLVNCGNRFFCEGNITPEDVAVFVWVVSCEYRVGLKHQLKFAKRHWKIFKTREAIVEIVAYLNRVFQDSPPSNGSGFNPQYTASVATLVDLFAREYGWSDNDILERPLARLFQMQRVIEHRIDPGRPQFNRDSDSVKSRWLASLNSRN